MATRCDRCGGNQFRIVDQYGDYLSCLQCGRTTDLAPSAALRAILEESDEVKPPARSRTRAR